MYTPERKFIMVYCLWIGIRYDCMDPREKEDYDILENALKMKFPDELILVERSTISAKLQCSEMSESLLAVITDDFLVYDLVKDDPEIHSVYIELSTMTTEKIIDVISKILEKIYESEPAK